MAIDSAGHVHQKLCIDLVALKHACPKGVYVCPIPDEPLLWTGVLFPRKGPYATAVLRFQVDFTAEYPTQPPVIKFLCDVFHPLVTPWTTYTHTTRDAGTDTVSSADEGRLPPGGLTLRHGFPEWHDERSRPAQTGDGSGLMTGFPWPHIVEVLQYMRVIFDSAEVIDTVPIDFAANTGAWHAWRTYRALSAPAVQLSSGAGETNRNSEHQPGGARRPGQWNWQGVWQDRVKKSILSSRSDQALFNPEEDSVINFQKLDVEA